MRVLVNRSNLRDRDSCSLSEASLYVATQKVLLRPYLYRRLMPVVLCWDAWMFRDHLPGR